MGEKIEHLRVKAHLKWWEKLNICDQNKKVWWMSGWMGK